MAPSEALDVLYRAMHPASIILIALINLIVLFGRPPSTMDAVWHPFLTAGERFIENTSSCRIKLREIR